MAQLRVRLADPLATLPLPGAPGVYAPPGAFTVDPASPYWSQALADGSVIPAPVEAEAADPAETAEAGPAKSTTKR